MKKVFSLVALMATALMASATDYTDTLVTYDVSYESQLGTSEQTITIEQAEDGTYSLELLNWISDGEFGAIGQGSFKVEGLNGEAEGGVTVVEFDGQISVSKGTEANIHMWNMAFMGTAVHPATFTLKFNDQKAYLFITVEADGMNGGAIGVFGTDEFQTTALRQLEQSAVVCPKAMIDGRVVVRGTYGLDGARLQ